MFKMNLAITSPTQLERLVALKSLCHNRITVEDGGSATTNSASAQVAFAQLEISDLWNGYLAMKDDPNISQAEKDNQKISIVDKYTEFHERFAEIDASNKAILEAALKVVTGEAG